MADISESVAETILSKLREQHPEHLRPHASVAISFIKDVNMAWNSTIGISSKNYMGDYLAKEIFERLPEDVIAKPMEVRTIHLICELYNEIGFEHFIKEDADAECSTPWQLNNRANSRSALGRYLEALPFLSRIDEDGFCSMSLDGHSSQVNIGFFLDHALAVFHSIKEGKHCVVPTRLDILTALLDLTDKIGYTNAPSPAEAGVSYRIL